MYYRGAHAAIVVYDITDPDSFITGQKWVSELRSQDYGKSVIIALAGNKSDLQNRRVSTKQAQEYAQNQNLLFFETSAKTAENVNRLFLEIAQALPKETNIESESKELSAQLLAQANAQPRGCC